MSAAAFQKCISPSCGATFEIGEVLHCCSRCGALLDVAYDWNRVELPKSLREVSALYSESGVWRFHSLLPFLPREKCLTIGEGKTLCHDSRGVADFIGASSGGKVFLQYEGMNPSGSFKDNGMVAAVSHGHFVGKTVAACASTGNTSASLAVYASVTKAMRAVIFIGSGKIAYGKLSQALDYGAKTIQIAGDFDDAMKQVQEVSKRSGIYLVNSLNPFRLEGQKTIMFRVLESLRWEVPDWIVCPGGNLGNSSSFGKAFDELFQLGLIKRKPRLAIINAAGANTLSQLVNDEKLVWNGGNYDAAKVEKFYAKMDAEHRRANTLASAIEINRPVNLAKCLRAIDVTSGVVTDVTDQEIVDAKAIVGRHGLGCEPASAASVAGAKKLVQRGVIGRDERVVCILTGHQLKDPNVTVAYHAGGASPSASRDDIFVKTLGVHGVATTLYANAPLSIENDIDAILRTCS
ncbi:MAG: threonine synthase [Thermoguttaceae bacterium]